MKARWSHGLLLAALFTLTGCGVDCEPVADDRRLVECAAGDPLSRWVARRTLRSAAAKLPPGRWQVVLPDGGYILRENSRLRLVKILADGRQEILVLPLRQQGRRVDLERSDRLLPWLLEGLDQLRRLRLDMRELHFEGTEPPADGELELFYLPNRSPAATGPPEVPQL